MASQAETPQTYSLVLLIREGGLQTHSERLRSGSITIGRAFDNRIILSDPHVSAHHLRVFTDGQTWFVEDLSSENGSQYLRPGKRRRPVAIGSEPQEVESGASVLIGRTRLSFYSPEHSVAAARPMIAQSIVNLPQQRPWLAMLVAAGAVTLSVIPNMLEDWQTPTFELFGIGALATGLLIACWATCFALLGFFLKRGARFFTHAFIAALALVPMFWLDLLDEYKDFYLDPHWVLRVIAGLLLFGLLFLALQASLRRATEYSLRFKLVGIVGAALIAWVVYSPEQETSWRPEYPGRLLPLPESMLGSQDLDSFYAELEDEIF